MKSKQDSHNSKENRSAAGHTPQSEAKQSMDAELMMFQPPDLGLNESIPLQKAAIPPVHPPVVQRAIITHQFISGVNNIVKGTVYDPGDARIAAMHQCILQNKSDEVNILPMFVRLHDMADSLNTLYTQAAAAEPLEEKVKALELIDKIISGQLGGNVLVGDDLMNVAKEVDTLSRYFKMGLEAVTQLWPNIQEDGMKNKYASVGLQSSKETYSRRVEVAMKNPEAPAIIKKMTSMLSVHMVNQAPSSVDTTLGIMMEDFDKHVKKNNLKNPTEKDCYAFCMKMAAAEPDLVADLNMDEFKKALLKMADMSYGPL
jgi:hypothetical protein